MGRLPGQVESVNSTFRFAMVAEPLLLKNRRRVAEVSLIISGYFSNSRERGMHVSRVRVGSVVLCHD